MTLVHRCFDHGTYEKKPSVGSYPRKMIRMWWAFGEKNHGILPMPGWISIARGDDHINFINQTWICHYMYYVNVYIYNYIYTLLQDNDPNWLSAGFCCCMAQAPWFWMLMNWTGLRFHQWVDPMLTQCGPRFVMLVNKNPSNYTSKYHQP